MNISKPLRIEGDVAVRVWNGSGGIEDIVVRKMDKVLADSARRRQINSGRAKIL